MIGALGGVVAQDRRHGVGVSRTRVGIIAHRWNHAVGGGQIEARRETPVRLPVSVRLQTSGRDDGSNVATSGVRVCVTSIAASTAEVSSRLGGKQRSESGQGGDIGHDLRPFNRTTG